MAGRGRGDFGVRYTSVPSQPDDSNMDREQPFAPPGMHSGLSYEELSNRVANGVTQIGSNVASVQRLAKQASNRGGTTSARQREQLASIQKTTAELIRTTNENMHRLESVSMKEMSAPQQKRHMLHLERLRSSFKETLSKYNTVTKEIVDREKKSVEEARRNVSLTHGGLNEDEHWEDVDDDEFLRASKSGEERQRRQQQQEQDESDLQAVRDREQALRALESDILDVNDIFRDLSQMVHEQGELVDHIESNIDTAAVDVEAAGDEIIIASRYQKKVRSKRCVLVGVLVAVVGVVALIIVLTNVHSN
ncbi:syntaxin-12-like [Sycon ciliatum]|uniref:syntaxin-12-like n=1 Tax=Sycon ciliatum TaxID=27933 RepID=UPI0031F6B45B